MILQQLKVKLFPKFLGLFEPWIHRPSLNILPTLLKSFVWVCMRHHNLSLSPWNFPPNSVSASRLLIFWYILSFYTSCSTHACALYYSLSIDLPPSCSTAGWWWCPLMMALITWLPGLCYLILVILWQLWPVNYFKYVCKPERQVKIRI